MGIDVLKMEFPLDILEDPEPAQWQVACRALSQASRVPWVLLSAGVSFDDFTRQTEIACKAGASGVLAGRAVWKEAVNLSGESRSAFLCTTAIDRLEKLKGIVSAYAKSWMDFYPGLSVSVQEGWYARY
jgi:tagatose-1,6-bisphosphate aldolase